MSRGPRPRAVGLWPRLTASASRASSAPRHALRARAGGCPDRAPLPAEPCPSLLLQQHMADLLRRDPDVAPSFLNSVLNQLNWAFSEFIGMIQEVGPGAGRAAGRAGAAGGRR